MSISNNLTPTYANQTINFFPCNTVAANKTPGYNGQIWADDSSMTAITSASGVAGVNVTSSNNTVTGKAIESVAAGDDWIIMGIFNFDPGSDSIITSNIAFGTGAGDAVNIGEGGISVNGANGSAVITWTGGDFSPNTEHRILVTFDANGGAGGCRMQEQDWGTALTAGGFDANTINTTTTGNLVALGNDITPTIAVGTIHCFGVMMVKFPNGLPADADLLPAVNELFDLWEAGNKLPWLDGVTYA